MINTEGSKRVYQENIKAVVTSDLFTRVREI
jgi:hypothetical protein